VTNILAYYDMVIINNNIFIVQAPGVNDFNCIVAAMGPLDSGQLFTKWVETSFSQLGQQRFQHF
jgi:hypothetical protein